MGAILCPLFSLVYLAAALWLLQRVLRQKNTPAGLVLGITLLGLSYDATVIFLGTQIRDAAVLLPLNQGRYLAHAVLTPLYFLLSGWFVRHADFKAARHGVLPALIILAGVSILVGLAGFFFLQYKPVEAAGTLRYIVNSEITPAWAHYAPIAVSVLIDVLFIVVGIGLWRRLRWPWLALAAVAMFFAAAVPPRLEFAFLISSAGELLLNAALLATCLRLKI